MCMGMGMGMGMGMCMCMGMGMGMVGMGMCVWLGGLAALPAHRRASRRDSALRERLWRLPMRRVGGRLGALHGRGARVGTPPATPADLDAFDTCLACCLACLAASLAAFRYIAALSPARVPAYGSAPS